METDRRTDRQKGAWKRSKWNMQPDKANGPEDEMLKELPIESVYGITTRFQRRLRRDCDLLPSWTDVQLVFLRKPSASAELCLGTRQWSF